MSTISFGKSSKNKDGQLVETRFGHNNTGGWVRFGEPNDFYLYKSLLNYLPKYIVQNDFCKALMKTFAIKLSKWQYKLQQLPFARTTGKTAYIWANNDLQCFVSSKAPIETIQGAISNSKAIHKARGTESGILADIKRLTNDPAASMAYYSYENCGWIGDVTFPEYLNGTHHSSNVFMDLDNMLHIKYHNYSEYSDSELEAIIREEIVPLSLNVKIEVSKPHVIRFNEPIGSVVQFGLFKFGEIVNP